MEREQVHRYKVSFKQLQKLGECEIGAERHERNRVQLTIKNQFIDLDQLTIKNPYYLVNTEWMSDMGVMDKWVYLSLNTGGTVGHF